MSADILVLTDVYSAGEAPIPGISGETIRAEVERQTGAHVIYVPRREDVAAKLAALAADGDLIITMGAGDIYRSGEELVALLEERNA